jgi:phosphate transport system permease protein
VELNNQITVDSAITRSEFAAGNSVLSDGTTAIKTSKTKRSYGHIRMENIFRRSLTIVALIILVLVLGIMITLIIESIPSIKSLGFKYLVGSTWDPVNDVYGALPFLIGTLLTSFLALLISLPFSYSIAIYLGEYKPTGWFSELLKNTVELIAAVPSVIYGFWGFLVLVPMVQNLEMSPLGMKLGLAPYGTGIFTASLILALMIIPYAASLGREMIRMVPSSLKEAAYALGATKAEVISNVVLPYTKSGLFAGILLSLGRALGETMAVTMVIGNSSMIPTGFFKCIFGPGNTMASVIANEFTEADHTLYLSALIELGLMLFVVTVIINIIGKGIIKKFTNE